MSVPTSQTRGDLFHLFLFLPIKNTCKKCNHESSISIPFSPFFQKPLDFYVYAMIYFSQGSELNLFQVVYVGAF